MIDVGMNYITQFDFPINKYDNVYKFLVENQYINTLKFPGKYCNYQTLEKELELASKIHTKVDIHGLPFMIPSIHSNNFLKDVEWEEVKKILTNGKNITRFSTHIGLENKDKIANYKEQELESNFQRNVIELREQMQNILNNQIEIGVENIPGGFDYDKQTITPEFISKSWQKVDFGVFDISHAKMAAKDLKMSYEEYLEKIEHKEKVKILHVSGNIDKTNQYENKPDKHVLIDKSEIKDILKTLNVFKNLDLIMSEYAFASKYSYEKELLIEAITLNTLVKTRDEEKTRKVLSYLKQNLKEDISNSEGLELEIE